MSASAFVGGPCVCRFDRGTCDETCMRELMQVPSYFACLRLGGRRCLVVGGGPVALEKVDALLACGASVTLVAPEAIPELAHLATERSLTWVRREYATSDLDGCLLAVAATDDTAVNVRVSRDADARDMLCNVADVPPLCSFILPAIVRSGPIAIAISTSGASPALAKRMRDEISVLYGASYARLAELLNEVRGWAKANLATYQDRRAFFESIVNGQPDPVELMRAGDEEGVRAVIADAQRRHSPG